MDALEPQLRELLEAHKEYFQMTDNGKIECTLNGHTLPPRLDAVSSFIQCVTVQCISACWVVFLFSVTDYHSFLLRDAMLAAPRAMAAAAAAAAAPAAATRCNKCGFMDVLLLAGVQSSKSSPGATQQTMPSKSTSRSSYKARISRKCPLCCWVEPSICSPCTPLP